MGNQKEKEKDKEKEMEKGERDKEIKKSDGQQRRKKKEKRKKKRWKRANEGQEVYSCYPNPIGLLDIDNTSPPLRSCPKRDGLRTIDAVSRSVYPLYSSFPGNPVVLFINTEKKGRGREEGVSR